MHHLASSPALPVEQSRATMNIPPMSEMQRCKLDSCKETEQRATREYVRSWFCPRSGRRGPNYGVFRTTGQDGQTGRVNEGSKAGAARDLVVLGLAGVRMNGLPFLSATWTHPPRTVAASPYFFASFGFVNVCTPWRQTVCSENQRPKRQVATQKT